MTRRRRGSRSRPKSDACQRRLGVGRTSLRATSSGICEFGNICPVSDSYIIILRSFLIQTAVRIHPRTGETAFFNNVVSRFCHAVEAGTLDPPHINSKGAFQPPALVRPILVELSRHFMINECQYGDGTLIPKVYLDSALEIIKLVLLPHGNDRPGADYITETPEHWFLGRKAMFSCWM